MDQGMTTSKASPWLIAALTLALIAPSVAADKTYTKGDNVTIQGQVVDAAGTAVGNVTVLLELSRTRFQITRFRKTKSNTLRIPVTTGSDGQYVHQWRWDGYYNTFGLAVAMPVSINGRQDFEVLQRVDITAQVNQGSPVEASVVLQETAYLEWLRRFVDGRAGAEEKRIFHELGRPDRIDAHDEGEYAWWYFQIGKVYRFRDGAIELIEPFDPILPP